MIPPTTRRLRAYSHGMTLLSTIHRLRDGYPVEDTYGEIDLSEVVPGGEAANGALILASYGLDVRLDGPWLGTETASPLREFLENRGVDCSLMRLDEGFVGWKDIVLCAGRSRSSPTSGRTR